MPRWTRRSIAAALECLEATPCQTTAECHAHLPVPYLINESIDNGWIFERLFRNPKQRLKSDGHNLYFVHYHPLPTEVGPNWRPRSLVGSLWVMVARSPLEGHAYPSCLIIFAQIYGNNTFTKNTEKIKTNCAIWNWNIIVNSNSENIFKFHRFAPYPRSIDTSCRRVALDGMVSTLLPCARGRLCGKAPKPNTKSRFWGYRGRWIRILGSRNEIRAE